MRSANFAKSGAFPAQHKICCIKICLLFSDPLKKIHFIKKIIENRRQTVKV